MSDALAYHRATDVPAGGTDEDEARMIGTKPSVFKDYADAERLPLETLSAGPVLRDGAGIVRTQDNRDYGGGTIHWRAYSSAGALFPVEAYVAARNGLYSFDPLSPGLVRIGGDVRARLAEAAALAASPQELVVLTGLHKRTGWKYMERGYRHIWWDAGTMLANVLALATADDLAPRLYTAFVDDVVNEVLGVDGEHEYALALLALGSDDSPETPPTPSDAVSLGESGATFPLALRAHQASSLLDADAVRAWRVPQSEQEPRLDRAALVRAIRRRRSVRAYSDNALPREELARLLAWSEAAIPADAASVVRQLVTVAAVEELEPGVYDAELNLLAARDEQKLREAAGFAAMEQDHPRDAAVNVFQLGDLDAIVARLGDRGYRWAQLEAGIRAGRLQIGAFMRGWGAAASTFYDDEVSRLLSTHESPLLMVAIGPR
jgi:SagB-type dehydrogenase family enzyme